MCAKLRKAKRYLSTPMVYKHNTPERYTCEGCGDIFEHRNTFIQHKKIRPTEQTPRIKPTKQYRTYDNENLIQAYNNVIENGWSVNYASKKYGVPLTTLRDRVDGRIRMDTKQGAPTFFTMKEEEDLCNHVKLLGDMGYGYGRNELGILAGDMAYYLRRKQSPVSMSKNWVSGFLRRWPSLKLTKPRSLSMERAKFLNEETVGKYYSELKKIIDKYDLQDKPESIYNIDETGISTEHKPHRVIGTKGLTTQAITSNRSNTATVIAAGNALGTALPPFFVFKGVILLPALLDGALPGTNATMSATGWSNSVIFQHYLETHFLKYCQRGLDPEKPILILYDGHASHVCFPVIEWARSKGIILFLLPPHTSHVLQPLDISCFGPFKAKYYKECQMYMKQNPGCQVLWQDMCRIACMAYTKGLSSTNIISAFKKAGIHPFDASSVTPDRFAPAKAVNCVQPAVKDNSPQGTAIDFLKEKEPQPVQPSATKKRVKLNIGGQAITEDVCYNMIKEKEKEKQEKENQKKTKKSAKLNKSQIVKKTCNISSSKKSDKLDKDDQSGPGNFKTVIDQESTNNGTSANSPQPGPSAYNIVASSDDELDSDDDVDDPNDLCCICGKNSPPAMRNLPYIYFVNWGKCDSCGHWTHLKFCCKIRVVRRGDNFLCPHCD